MREAVYSALERLVEAIPGVRTFGRRLKHWSDVDAGEQPAIYLVPDNQRVELKGHGLPPLLHMPVKLYLYNQNHDPAQQNDLLDAIGQALVPPKGEESLTLGGLAHHCRIEGEIETDAGFLGEQAVAIIPIEILISEAGHA